MYTYGFILNEIFRRVDPERRTIGECLRQDVSEPLNVAAYIGLKREELRDQAQMSMRSRKQVFWGSLRPKCMNRKVQCSFKDVLERARAVAKIRKTKARSVPPIESLNPHPLVDYLTSLLSSPIVSGELPSTNGHASANALGKIAAVMANKGELNGERIMSEKTWDAMHKDYKHSNMFPHLGTANFSAGGLNHFDTVPNPYDVFKANELRKGFIGWMGVGGSVMQWNPELKIGFAYVPTLGAWEDPSNAKGALLQKAVVECVTQINREAGKTSSPVETINHGFSEQ